MLLHYQRQPSLTNLGAVVSAETCWSYILPDPGESDTMSENFKGAIHTGNSPWQMQMRSGKACFATQ